MLASHRTASLAISCLELRQSLGRRQGQEVIDLRHVDTVLVLHRRVRHPQKLFPIPVRASTLIVYDLPRGVQRFDRHGSAQTASRAAPRAASSDIAGVFSTRSCMCGKGISIRPRLASS
jgi:hypothetical protein